MMAEINQLILRGRATGALLDREDDRWAAQSLLDYWSSLLYRAGLEPPEATLVEFDPDLAPDLADKLCPYLGLEAFREKDESLFFGRQRLLEKLLKHLETQSLLMVVGSSGSGKSSLVLGGLFPRLKAGALPGSQDWVYYPPLVPGSNPLVALAQRWPGVETAPTVSALLKDPEHLLHLTSAATSQPVVLIIDQFEEVFTLCREEEVRHSLAQNLLHFIQAPDRQNRLILTLRTDFESQFVRSPELLQLFDQSAVRVTALDAAELREAIERPADLVGLKFEEGLVDTLLNDVLGEPAALPLLQFTLLKLWDHRDHNRVTWEAYRRLGGGRLALARSADESYNRLIPEEQVTVKRLLLRMVRPGEGLEVTSNRIPRGVLYRSGEAQYRVDEVLEKLIQARLVRLTEGDRPEDAQVEVAHEALIRNWPRLVDWLEEERFTLRQRLRLTEAAEQWQTRVQEASLLWRGALLAEAARYEDLSPLEHSFLQASQAVEAAERQKDLQQHQFRKRAMGGLVVLSLATACLLSIVSYQQLRQANRQRVSLLATTAQLLSTTQPVEAALNNIVAYGLSQSTLINWPRDSRSNNMDNTLLGSLLTTGQQPLEQNRLTGHTDPVRSVAFSPDGKRIVSGSDDRTLRLWNANTGQPIGDPLQGHQDTVRSVAFSPDGKRIVSGSDDMTLRLWDAQSGQPIGAPLTGHTEGVSSVAFSPDGKSIVSGGWDGTLRLWDATTGQPIGDPLQGHRSGVFSVAFSPDGKRLVSGSADNTLRLWDATTGQPIGAPLPDHQSGVFSVAFSPDGKHIVSSSYDQTLRIWDAKSRKCIHTVFSGTVYSISFSPDSKRIVSGSADNALRMWDVNTGESIGSPLQGHQKAVRSVAFSLDGKRIVSGGDDNTLRLWNVTIEPLRGNYIEATVPKIFQPDGERILGPAHIKPLWLWNTIISMPLTGHRTGVLSVAFSHDGSSIVSGSYDQTVRIWDVSNGKQTTPPLQGHQGPVSWVTFILNGKRIVSGSYYDQTLRIWDTNVGKLISSTLRSHQDLTWSSVALSRDEKYLVTSNKDGTMWLWDINTRQPIGPSLKGHTGPVWSVAFSPDGKRIVSGSADSTLRLWNVTNGQPIEPISAPLQGHTDGVRSVAFSPDGKRIVSGSADMTLRLWDATTGQPIGTPLTGHQAEVTSVAFSPDGKRIVSGSSDKTLRLWDATTGQSIGIPLTGHQAGVTSVAFSPDGKHLVSGSDDTTLRLWVIDPQQLVQTLCQHLQQHTALRSPQTDEAKEARRTCDNLSKLN
jgi:WD40 repeat protein